MGDLTTYTSSTISDLMSNINRVRFNPSNIQRTILDVLDEVTDGEVDIVDPTNPFVFLLESSCVNTSLAITESAINLRKQYPSLAQTEDELYLHMSDKDFIGRFATPGFTDFTFMVSYKDVLNKMAYDNVEKCYKAIIPRNTEITINDLTFSFQYPIIIRRFSDSIVQISYDSEILDPVKALTSAVIDYDIRRDSNQEDWLFFKVNLSQFKVETSYHNIQQSITFDTEIPFSDKFAYCRVFNNSSLTDLSWVEIPVTHTDQVFDPFKPTVTLRVYEGKLKVTIPIIYINTGMMDGDIRVDIYTTKGALNVDLSDNKISSFQIDFKAIDDKRDINEYTNAITELTLLAFSDQTVNNGNDGITFDELRKRVINNSTGDRQLPITSVQLEASINNKGFELISNIDVITNRIFTATKKLPKPYNTKLLTSANIGISSFITSLEYLKTIETVKDNNTRLTILSSSLFENVNGKIKILNKSDIDGISSLPTSSKVNTINSRNFIYTPFHYVLDNSQKEFEIRAYLLDQPTVNDISFISQNETLQLLVNTNGFTIEKTHNGYKLSIVTKSGDFYKGISDSLVNCQLAFKPIGENTLAYINGTLVGKTSTEERIYEFTIETNYDLNQSNNICITNFMMFNANPLNLWCSLEGEFYIFHTTSSISTNFVPDATDSKIAKFLLPNGSVGNTEERIKYKLGDVLKNLWMRSRSLASGLTYETYETDIPLLYDRDVFETNPITGSILFIDGSGNASYNKLHSLGDPVLNAQNEQIYKHRKGDVKLDQNGSPIVTTGISSERDIDILFIDGKYYFANDESFINYRSEVAKIIKNWVVNDLADIHDDLIDQTKLFFYPKSSLGVVSVYPDNIGIKKINSEQSLVIDFYVKDKIYRDGNIRALITDSTIKTIDEFINKEYINLTEIILTLNNSYKDIIESISVSGLGGSENYQIVKMANNSDRLSLKKSIVAQQDGKLIIKEDITISFNNTERVIA